MLEDGWYSVFWPLDVLCKPQAVVPFLQVWELILGAQPLWSSEFPTDEALKSHLRNDAEDLVMRILLLVASDNEETDDSWNLNYLHHDMFAAVDHLVFLVSYFGVWLCNPFLFLHEEKEGKNEHVQVKSLYGTFGAVWVMYVAFIYSPLHKIEKERIN